MTVLMLAVRLEIESDLPDSIDEAELREEIANIVSECSGVDAARTVDLTITAKKA